MQHTRDFACNHLQVKMAWLFDSVEKGLQVDRTAFCIGLPGAGDAEIAQSQDW